MISTLLGGLTAQQFLSEYWQKKPLLIRNAIPGFKGIASPAEVKSLTTDEDIESRLIWQENGLWQMGNGPFRKRDFPKTGPWTTLVQGLNLVSDEGDALLRQFNFVPYARLDDLMVSYATDGGGVGPHFDSYDVFLLQGLGKRRWQISAQRDLTLIEDAPLKILKNFKSTKEWVLEAGDMLYLPPRYAHNGIAIGECMTYSIGFRAPSEQELGTEFLSFVQDKLELKGMYADPDLRATTKPAEIQIAMLDQVAQALSKIRWSNGDIAAFLGQYLSEPKPHVFFDPPENPLSLSAFRRQAILLGVKLDLSTQMLYWREDLFINGEKCNANKLSADKSPGKLGVKKVKPLQQLANQRSLSDFSSLSNDNWELLHDWYCNGYLSLNQASG